MLITLFRLVGEYLQFPLEILSPLAAEAAHAAASGSVTVTDVAGVNEFNVDVSTFAPTAPEASAPRWTFSTLQFL